MNLSFARQNEVIAHLAGFRFLTQSQIDEFLFAGSSLTALSRQVIVRRILVRLRTQGLVQATPRVVAPAGGTARLAYFLTAAGYNRAREQNSALRAGRPGIRSSTLMEHGLACPDVALAFRRLARSRPGHEVLDWECDWQAAERLGSTVVVPHAHMSYATANDTLEVFIEVDRATEGSKVFRRKVRRYLDLYWSRDWRRHLKQWPIVFTVTTTATRARLLKRVTETVLDAQYEGARIYRLTRFRFATLDDVTSPAGPFAQIWQRAGESGLHAIVERAPVASTP
ncbi:MAG: replication-relaxation family protein [Chloroflexota bacterium]|nr:replication-relaxation family protein [Chloroflexota bacterium]